MEAIMTHQPVLAACVAATTGPILELGAGDYSTPFLHGFCLPTERWLVTVEANAEWLNRFSRLARPWHQLVRVNAYDEFDVSQLGWSVAFLDHAPADRRAVDVVRLKPHARLLVLHDSESAGYGYEALLPTFRYRRDCRLWPTWTTVVSDVDELAWLEFA